MNEIHKKIAPLVVWYNPDNECVKNILSYSKYFEKIFIIDNSENENIELASQIKNSVYLPLHINTGIAKALNTGSALALKNKYEYVMTMDQDSYFDDEDIKQFVKLLSEYITENKYNIFCPYLKTPEITSITDDIKNFIKRKILHRKAALKDESPVSQLDYCISSGSVISLDKWNELNGFNEDFYIDDVDHEFCLRLNQKYPFSILRFNTVFMNHKIGNEKKTFFHRTDFHNPVRLYYITRNAFYMRDIFPDFSKKYDRIKKIFRIFFEYLRIFRFKHCYYMIKGYSDYKKNIKGKLIQKTN